LKGKKKGSWSDVKTALKSKTTGEQIDLVRDLYRLSTDNRRFLHTRLLDPSVEFAEYRRQVADSIAPDPFGRGRISIAEAKSAIRAYRDASGDMAGTLDLMLVFVESGTEYCVDLGLDDEAYIDSLASMLDTALGMLGNMTPDKRTAFLSRLKRIADRARCVGWGWGDFAGDSIARSFPELLEG